MRTKNYGFFLLSLSFLLLLLTTSNAIPMNLKASGWGWTDTELLSNTSTGNSYNPSIGADSKGNVHVVWDDWTNDYLSSGSDADIFYKFWDAATETWNTTMVISTESTGNSEKPALTVDDDDNIHVVWEDVTGGDRDIYYKFWNATTQTWNTTAVVSTESTGNSFRPALVVDDENNVHITWDDVTSYGGSGGDSDIFYKFWNATSKTWNTTTVVSTTSLASYSPTISVDNSINVHIAWDENSGADTDIYYKFWNETTNIWSTTTLVSTESSLNSNTASMGIDNSGNIHIAWRDGTNYDGCGTDTDIFYKFWNAASKVWNLTSVLSLESDGNSWSPKITLDSTGNIYAVWQDHTDYDSAGTDRDVFYKKWNKASGSWGLPVVISPWSIAESNDADIALDNTGTVNIIWYEWTDYLSSDSDRDIFYRKYVYVEDENGGEKKEDDDDDETPLAILGYDLLFIIGIIIISSSIIVKKRINNK